MDNGISRSPRAGQPVPDDSEVTSSHRLRLRPGAHIFEISGEQIQIAFANYTMTFTSPPVVKGLRVLLQAFEPGGERQDVVCKAMDTTGLEGAFLHYLVELLLQNDCLYPEGVEPPRAAGMVEQAMLAEFYASLGNDPSAALAALAAVQPVVITPAAASHDLAQILHSSGLAAEVVPIAPGLSCAVALAEIKGRMPSLPALLVSWNFSYRSPFARLLNDLAIEERCPILFGACEGIIGRIGPYVIPRNTACLECCNSRLLAHAGSPELRALAEYRARYQDLIPAPWPTHPTFHDAMTRLFVLELTHIVMKRPPRTIGGIIEHSFTDSVAQRHPIYKLPRCPACHAARPERIAWDAPFPAPVIHSVADENRNSES